VSESCRKFFLRSQGISTGVARVEGYRSTAHVVLSQYRSGSKYRIARDRQLKTKGDSIAFVLWSKFLFGTLIILSPLLFGISDEFIPGRFPDPLGHLQYACPPAPVVLHGCGRHLVEWQRLDS
jgi:hypothetical protein